MAGMDGVRIVDSKSFTIPSLPPTMNAIYNVIFKLRKIELKPEVRSWKNTCMKYVPMWTPRDSGYMHVDCQFLGNWYYKNGNVKRLDLQNLTKVLIDAISEKMRFDDKIIFAYESGWKHQSERSEVKVTMNLFEWKDET